MKSLSPYDSRALLSTGLAAYIILILSRTPALSYFAVYLAISAIYSMIRESSKPDILWKS